jgi:hypothetical protein
MNPTNAGSITVSNTAIAPLSSLMKVLIGRVIVRCCVMTMLTSSKSCC